MELNCSIIRDLLPLYIEGLASKESAELINEHLKNCPECQKELEAMKNEVLTTENAELDEDSTLLKKIMQKLNMRISFLTYGVIVFFILFGFSLTEGADVMYNSLIMPIVGVFGYVVFGWRAVYKMPILLLVIDFCASLFNMVSFDLYSVFMWTLIYGMFVMIGIAIAFLFHFAFRKEK